MGPELPAKVVELSYQKAKATKGEVKGNIPILDIQYGNVWSNISDELLNQAGIKLNDTLCVTISEGSQQNTQENAVCRKLRRCAGRPADGVSEQLIECFRGAEYG